MSFLHMGLESPRPSSPLVQGDADYLWVSQKETEAQRGLLGQGTDQATVCLPDSLPVLNAAGLRAEPAAPPTTAAAGPEPFLGARLDTKPVI